MDCLRKQFIIGSDSSRPNLHQNALERDRSGCSLEKETISETGNRGGSYHLSPISIKTRSRSSDSAISAHSSTSSGIDPGLPDFDDGYGTWNNRKSTLKTRNQFANTWNSVALQTPERKRVSKNCQERDFKPGETRGFDEREQLVVKVCNSCNARTVLIGEKKQTSQRSLPFFCESNTKNPSTLPPKIIVSSANNNSNKKSAFDTVDFSANSRHGDIAFDIRDSKNNSSDDIQLESNSSNNNADIMNNAFDTVDFGKHYLYSKEPSQHNVKRVSISEDWVQTNSWSNVADKAGVKAPVNYDKSQKAIDSKEILRQQLTNCSDSVTGKPRYEADEQFANGISPKALFAEFPQEKDKQFGRVERRSKREIQVQLPRTSKNVSILENGVLFRPGFGNRGTASQCNGSKAIKIASHGEQKLEEDVIGCVWTSAPSSDDEESPVDDQPPADFVISSDTESSLDSLPYMDALTKKTGLLLNTMRSVEILLNHFDRNRSSRGQVGSTQSDCQVGHLVLDHLCPALLAILLDGLKPELHGFLGSVRNSVRQVIEESATLGHPPNLVKDLVTSLKSLKFLNTPLLFFNAFVFALLNCKALEFWLSYVHRHASLLQKHYASVSFLRLSHSTGFRGFQDLVVVLQPLALLPFRLEYNFEVRIQEERLEYHRARSALERPMVLADVRLGLVEIQQNFSNDRLLECSQKSAEERQFLEKAELASDESLQCASVEVNNGVGSNQRPSFAWKTHIQDINIKVGSNVRPPVTPKLSPEVVGSNERPPMTSKSSPGFVGVRATPPIELAAETPEVANNHEVNCTPSYQNYQRKSETQSIVCPVKQINCELQENLVPCHKAPSAVFTQRSNTAITAARTLWSECSQRFGLVKHRLEQLVFASS